MSIEFTAPPASRRERREREQLLISQGYSPEQAALIAEGSGAVTESASEPTPAVSPEVLHGSVDEPRPEAASTIPHADSAVAPAPGVPAVFGILPSRRELRERAAGAQAGGVVPGTGTPVITPSTPAADPAASNATAETPSETPSSIPAGDDAPEPDVEIIEVVENLFTSEPARAELDPTHVPTEPGLENGPLHWTEALALPANLDPTDPASMPHLPALVSDTNTIVLDDIPGAGALTQVTGEIDLVVTGSILLPTSLTETGALDHLIDSDESSDRDDDIADEMPLSHLAPKSASAAVNANSSAPAMVSEPVRQRMGVPMIVALAAGGATGIVLIALGLGALLHLF